MALVISDRTRETSTSTGLGNFTLAGAQAGFQTFGAHMAVGDTTWYAITGPGGSWETGVGTLVAANTLERTTPLESSNGDAKVNFAAGTKDVFVTIPGKRASIPDDLLRRDGTLSMTGRFKAVAASAGASSVVIPVGSAEPGADTEDGGIWNGGSAWRTLLNGVKRTFWDSSTMPTVTQADAEAGSGTTPKAWSEQRVRQAAIAADREVLLRAWDAAELSTLAEIIYDLPVGYPAYAIVFGNLGLNSGSTDLGLRCGPAGGAIDAGTQAYSVAISQQRGQATDNLATAGGAIGLINLDQNATNSGRVDITDGTFGFFTTRAHLMQLMNNGDLVISNRSGRHNGGGGRKGRIQLTTNGVAFRQSGFIRILGVR